MGSFQLKGKQQEMTLHSVYLSAGKDAIKQRRRRLFVRRTKKMET
jgi:hypothetical protein